MPSVTFKLRQVFCLGARLTPKLLLGLLTVTSVIITHLHCHHCRASFFNQYFSFIKYIIYCLCIILTDIARLCWLAHFVPQLVYNYSLVIFNGRPSIWQTKFAYFLMYFINLSKIIQSIFTKYPEHKERSKE